MPQTIAIDHAVEPDPDATRHWRALRELVIAGEAAGWDIGENKATLDGARDALDSLAFVLDVDTGEPAGVSPRCPNSAAAGQ